MGGNFDAESFDGISLNSDEQKNLLNHIRSTLGESNFTLAKRFFESIWNSGARYKVFLARRCLNLMYTFYRAIYSKPIPESSTFYSDGSLLASVPEIAEGYLRWGGFPEIVIVDDILIHGRTLNDLIDSLVNSVCEYIKIKQNGVIERSRIETALLSSLSIKTMVQTNKPLLLRDQYYQCLKGERNQSDVWIPRRWRELSLRISQLILENFFYNTSYVLSLYLKNDLNYISSIVNTAIKSGFKKFEYVGRFGRTVLVKPLERGNGEIVAFYTIRISRNRVSGGYSIVPFVIMSDFVCDLSKPIFGDNKTANDLFGCFANCYGGERIKAEALYLMLSHNILLLLNDEVGGIALPDMLDIDKISIAFKSSVDKNSNFLKRVAELTKPFMSSKEMDNYILNATANSHPLFERASEGSESDFNRIIEDIIAEEGRVMERNAFLEYSQGIYSPQRTGKHPVIELFSKLSRRLNIQKIDLSELVSKLLELMDMGSTAISTKKSDALGQNCIICGYRPGEQSLFILPKRYAQELPVLIMMENDCYSNLYSIKKRIDVLYQNTPEYADELKRFVDGLYDSGQRLIDWDINMLLWSEISEQTRMSYRDKKDNEILLISQMLFNISRQSELTNLYRSIYPENQ